jgi:hypothetical protein
MPPHDRLASARIVPRTFYRPSGLHLGGNSHSSSAATNDKLNLLLLLLGLTSPGMAAMLAKNTMQLYDYRHPNRQMLISTEI